MQNNNHPGFGNSRTRRQPRTPLKYVNSHRPWNFFNEEYQAQFNAPDASASTRIHNAFITGLDNATATLLGIVLFLEEDGPVILIWLAILGAPAFFLWRRYRKARSRF